MPIPQSDSLEAINEQVRQHCLADQQRTMARRDESISSRLERELAFLGPLPVQAPELGLVVEVLVRSTGRVRFQTNDYSVPIQYAYQRLTDPRRSVPGTPLCRSRAGGRACPLLREAPGD